MTALYRAGIFLLVLTGCGASRRDQILSALDAVNGASLVVQTALEKIPRESLPTKDLLAANEALETTYTYLIQGYRLAQHQAWSTVENLLACARDELRASIRKILPTGHPLYMLDRAFREINVLKVGQCLRS